VGPPLPPGGLDEEEEEGGAGAANDVGPAPPPKKKRKVLEFEGQYLAALPSAAMYERSYMHRYVRPWYHKTGSFRCSIVVYALPPLSPFQPPLSPSHPLPFPSSTVYLMS
jgi:hypothetical protein